MAGIIPAVLANARIFLWILCTAALSELACGRDFSSLKHSEGQRTEEHGAFSPWSSSSITEGMTCKPSSSHAFSDDPTVGAVIQQRTFHLPPGQALLCFADAASDRRPACFAA